MEGQTTITTAVYVIVYDCVCVESGSIIGGPAFEFPDSVKSARKVLSTLRAELERKVENEIACIGSFVNFSPYCICGLWLSLPLDSVSDQDLRLTLRSKIGEFGENYLKRRVKGYFGTWYTPQCEHMAVGEILEMLSQGLEALDEGVVK